MIKGNLILYLSSPNGTPLALHEALQHALLLFTRPLEITKGLVVADGQVEVQVHESKHILRWPVHNTYCLFCVDFALVVNKSMSEDLSVVFFLGTMLECVFSLLSVLLILEAQLLQAVSLVLNGLQGLIEGVLS